MGFEDLSYLWENGIRSRKISRVNLEEGAYLYKVVAELKSPLIVEIGTSHGGTTKLLQEANILGTIITLDLELIDIKTELNITRTHLIKTNSTEVDTEVFVKEIGEVDLLFIDGNHLFEGVKADWDNWNKAVKVEGHIIFHDCYIARKKYLTVIDLIKELKKKEIIGKQYIEKPAVASLCHLRKVE